MRRNTKGFLIIEVLLAIVILSMVFLSLFSMVSFLTNRTERSKFDGQAAALLQQGMEIGRSTVLSRWTLPNRNYYPVYDADTDNWTLRAGDEGLLQGRFMRNVSLESVCRLTSDGAQASCTTAPIDPQSKHLKVVVTWKEGTVSKQVEATLLLFNKSS